MDSMALIVASGLSFKCFAMLAARDYFYRSGRVFNPFGAMLHLIPIDRSPGVENFRQTILLCRKFLDDSLHGLIMFPEGTRSRTGTIGSFKRGVALFASTLGVPVIPAYVQGTFSALPVGSFFPRPHRIRVTFGEPIYPPMSARPKERECFLHQMREGILSMEARPSAI